MSDDLVKRWDEYVDSMGSVMGEVEHMAQQMRDHIEELEIKLSKAIEALDEAIYLLDPDEEDITKETGLYRIVEAFKELKGEQP